MNDTELRLAAWLHAATPEPPRMIAAGSILNPPDAVSNPHRVAARRTWAPVLAAVACVVLVVLALIVASAVRSHHRSLPSAPTPSPRVTSPAPTPRPSAPAFAASAPVPTDYPALRIVGAAGRAAWRLTNTLSVSADGGQTWSTVSLPNGLSAAAISTIDVGPDGVVWLQTVHGRTVELYRGARGTWQRTQVTIDQPAGLSGLPAPAQAAFDSRGPIVAIVEGGGTDQVHAYADLLLSTDGGASFVQRPTGIEWAITSVAFVNSQVGLAVAGPADNYVYRTADAGRTWNRLLGGSPTGTVAYEAPTVTATGVELARFSEAGRGEQEVTILTSSDDGATFRSTGATPLAIPEPYVTALPVASINGSDVWVAANGRIYQSADDGRTWSTIRTGQSLTAIDVVGAAQAVGQASSTCSSNSATQQCRSANYLVVTADGGRAWRSI